MLTKNSTLGALLKNPIGRDILGRLTRYAGMDDRLIDNPLVRSLKLSALPRLSGGKVSDKLLDTLMELFNQDEGLSPLPVNHDKSWWREAVVYQIYPRSFMDSNGDGIGDLRGILQKLDYLSALGVTAVWLSPVFDSPNDDNGYDVRDYRKIMTEFGSMADMDALIQGLHARGIKLILDLVLNHTSDEHAWFRSSLNEPDGPCGEFYYWRDGEEDAPPNNWQSFFGGSAWNYYPERKAHALHLFSKKQMDLNWDNPAVREGVFDIVRFWREKGADGFRLDVINYISKTSFKDGDETLGALLGFSGVEHYFYGNRLHEYLKELRAASGDAFLIGETPGTGPEMNKLLTAPSREELSTVFCFDHLDAPGRNRFDLYRYDLNHLKKCFIEYEGAFADFSWPSIFVENHDNPRMPSKVDTEGKHHDKLSKLFAVLLLTARGTPFIYQGQELGAADVDFQSIGELRDVESINRYHELCDAGDPEAWARIRKGTRDQARTPMQWTAGEGGGFSEAQPWIRMADPKAWNAASQMDDESSVFHAYKSLIALRRGHPALVYGEFLPLYKNRRDLFCYVRGDEAERFLVVANLSEREMPHPTYAGAIERVYGSYPDAAARLRPYEACVYRVKP